MKKNTNRVNLFIAGCQKTGSTWLYHCFNEHPDVFVPRNDALHYFTINYFRGEEWYDKWFSGANGESIICDPTPSYIRDPFSAERIYRYNPDAKLIFTLRNPIERSFSHYWHQKRKKNIAFSFKDTLHYSGLGNYDIFDIWIKSSLYFHQLKSFFEIFPRENIRVNLFGDLKNNPESFIEDIFEFTEVDTAFKPSILFKKVNNAPIRTPNTHQTLSLEAGVKSAVKKFANKLHLLPEDDTAPVQDEYSQGVSYALKKELWEIFREDVSQLSQLIDRDLSAWEPTQT